MNSYLQIFNYLKAFAKLRNRPIYDIESSKQYQNIWLDSIENNNIFYNALNNEDKKDYWLKLKKPKEPKEPNPIKPPKTLIDWIDEKCLYSEDTQPFLKEEITLNGEILHLSNHPELQEALDYYINHKWSDKLLDYQNQNKEYQLELSEYKKLLGIYQKFFKFYEELRDKSDTHELVIGVGLFHYKKDSDSREYYRHIITQAVNIKYSQSVVTVQVSDENPKIEKDFIHKEFNEISIDDTIKYFDSIVKDEDKDDINLLDNQNIEQILEGVCNQIGIEQYDHQINKPKTLEKKIISYAPTLILRKKNASKLDEAYTEIIKQVESQGNSCKISLIDSLLGENSHSDTSDSPDNDSLPEIIYFPNPSNNEQIKILEKSRNNNAVMVQGPPGTGKSHTIANLICHLLATGNKVLATAHTKPALEVLKEKLPKEYQGLVVDYLGSDQTSKDNLTASVNIILNNINNSPDYDTSQDEQQLKNTKEETAKYTNQHKVVIRHDTEKITVNANYQGMLVEILEQLKTDKEQFLWYQDNYFDTQDNQLQEQLEAFIALNKKHQLQKSSDFQEIADLTKIPTPAQVERYNELTDFSTSEAVETVKSNHLDTLSISLKSINELSKQIQELYQGQSLDNFIDLCDKASKLGKLFKSPIKQEILEELDNTKIDCPDKDLKILRAHAKNLLLFLESGKKLQDLSWLAKKRLPIDIKEQYYFVDAVRVNDSPCDTIDEFKTVIAYIETKQILQELQSIHSINHNSYIEQINAYQNIVDNANTFTEIKTQADTLAKDIFQDSGLQVEYLKTNNIDELLKRIEWTSKHNEWKKIDAIINKTQAYLNTKEPRHSADNWIDFEKLDKYQEFYQQIKNLNDFKELQQQLSQKIPNTIEQILTGELVILEQLSNAIRHKHAQHYVNKLPQENTTTLKQKIKQNQEKEKQLITKIGANKAWQGVVNNTDDHLKIELKLWQDAISKISNTNSKRTQKYRKIAKQKMAICKDVIPCWIMPLQQLVNTIIPQQGMYDYIIVDEASQLDIDAMLLLYLAKKIIIVGDNQQIAPENISADKRQVESAINEHLKNIPNKEFYDTEHSFFDLAKIHFHTNITLREHFRCMPEIIEFSNKLCYAPNNTPLYPLRTYSEKRLTPLKNVFCDNGYIEGKGSNIINKPEAQSIVEKIAEIIKDERYQNKTIGVITLQGNTQKDIIHNLLLEKIDEKEYTARKILCGNPASFQGDERDIIFLSLVTADNHNRTALTKDTDKRRFNVAVSRAKDQVWLFHSVQLNDLRSNDFRYKLLEYITTYMPEKFAQSQLIPVPSPKPMYGDDPKPKNPFRSWFEVEVYNDILTKNYQVIPAHKIAGYEIDLVPICADGTKIAVECDGDYWHGDKQYNKDMQRQDILERAGWQFFRIRYSEYLRDKDKATQGLWELLKRHSIKPKPVENKVKQDNTPLNDTNPKVDIAEVQQELKIQLSHNTDNTSDNQDSQVLCFFNLYQSGNYILSKDKKDDADLILAIESRHKNGYLLQCYDNGHINKFKVSALLERSLNREYKNGFNIKTNMPQLTLLEKDEIIGITFKEQGEIKFKAHLTKNLPEKDNLSIQSYKVVYNDGFSDAKYKIIPMEKLDKIERLVFDSFNARGKETNNTYYQKEWKIINP